MIFRVVFKEHSRKHVQREIMKKKKKKETKEIRLFFFLFFSNGLFI